MAFDTTGGRYRPAFGFEALRCASTAQVNGGAKTPSERHADVAFNR